MRLHIVNAPGDQSYPIATYTYILIYREMSSHPNFDKAKAEALAKFLWWAIHDGQKYAPDLIYAPLPDNIVKADETLLLSLTFQGAPVISQ
jgi:phosphate transport system substrate-binding protein